MIQYYYTKKEWGVVMEKEELKILEELRRILNSKNEAIVILNNYFKGGVGKSKLSTMFAYLTDKFNLKVLMIDKDLQARIIVITGSPGTGKTTTASIVAKESDMDKSVHMHTDDFFHYLSKGAIPPHLPESNKQNLVVIEAFLEAAKRYARGGYDVIVDGIVGPWFLEPWKALAQEDYEVHYIVLRASKKETMKRAVERSKLDRKTNIELVETMWEQFSGLGIYESNVIDTTTFTIKDTVSAIKERVACGTSLLS